MATEPELFHSGADRTGYIQVKRDGVLETFPIMGSKFSHWVSDLQHDVTKTIPDPRDVQVAQRFINYVAGHKRDPQDVGIRTAPHPDGGIVVDLGTADWRQVHVTPGGWTITDPDPRVKFIRPVGVGPMIVPARAESGKAFAKVLAMMNVEVDDQRLLAAWMTFALRPAAVPYPILILQGEQGSG